MHGGGADAKASPHRAQGLSAQNHRFHHLALSLVQQCERRHGLVAFLRGLPFGQAVLAEEFEPQSWGVLQEPRR
jgi:hypothetical protein